MKRTILVAAVCGLALTLLAGTRAGAAAGPAAGPAPRVTTGCAPGQVQLTFANSSTYGDGQVFADVVLSGGAIVQSQLVDTDVPLQGNYPVDLNDGNAHSYYVCLKAGAKGRIWLSLGQPISGLPSVQPTVTEPYRFAYVEFADSGADPTVDVTNVNNFDFPLDLSTYAVPGGADASATSDFSADTCTIVNAFHTAVEGVGHLADWNTIETTSGGSFVRIASPSNGQPGNGGYPDMTPYVDALINALPVVGSGPYAGDRGPLTVEDYYVGSTPPSPPYSTTPTTHDDDAGWYDYQGYFDASGTLTLVGTLHGDLQPGGSGAATGYPITVSKSALATGIYDQGSEYTVVGAPAGYADGNDVYAKIWNDLTGAFDYGYWGSDLGTGFDTRYFFGTWPVGTDTSPSGGAPAFAHRTASFLPVPGGIAYNLYASVLSRYSPNYLLPYGENYGAGGTGRSPDIAIPQNGEIRVTLPPDGWAGASGSSTCTSGGPTAGYDEVAADGGIFSFGDAGYYGSTAALPLNAPVVGLARTPDDRGYWLVAADGGIFSFGDAGFHGSTGALRLNKPIVGMASTSDGDGYWLVAADGGIFAFGDAGFHGSTGSLTLNQPIVGMAATPDGRGYWLVAADGGIFAFGDAGFHGSTGGFPLNQPIVGMAPSPGGTGYWLVAADGGIFTFGSAVFHGSAGAIPLNAPVVGMAPSPGGTGYWLVAADGGIFTFGAAPFYGSAGAVPLQSPVIGIG